MTLKWKAYVLLKKYFWIILALVLIVLRWLGGLYPVTIEYTYSRGIFLVIRGLIDYTVASLPVPLFYIFWLIAAIIFARYLVRSFQKKYSLRKRLLRFGFHTLNFICGIIVWFLLIWGFNYGRIPIEDQLNMTLRVPELEQLRAETQWATKKTLDLRTLVSQDTTELNADFLPKGLEQEMRKSLESVLAELNYPTLGKVRARQLYPKGILLRLRTSGIYWFFVGEGNLDAGLHSLQKPFTMAHEMAHGYGFGDEGTCNFLAYLACLKSNHPYVRYAGMLTYWRYIAGEYKFRALEEYEIFRAAHLSAGMKNDLEAIYENAQSYPNMLSSIRDQTYDSYLKLQGIEDGLENYNRVILLVDAWKRR